MTDEIQVFPDASAGYVQLDRHTGVLRRFAVAMQLEDGIGVRLEIEVDDQGHASCRKIEVSADEVNGEMLRKVPVARLLATAMSTELVLFKFGEPPPGELRIDFGEKVARLPTTKERAEFYADYAKGARHPRRGSPLTEDNLRQVADVYRLALQRGDPPTQTVADQMNVVRSTASRWVAAARKRGFLGPALRGRAGEAGIEEK
jgi:hypothetical protein